MKGLEIRPILEGDAPVIKELLMEERTEPFFPMGDPHEFEEGSKYWVSIGVNERAGLVALYQGVPVGMGLLFLHSYKRLKHQATHVMFVSAQFRRMGIGSALLRALMELAKREGVELLSVEVYDDPGVALFYKKQKFVEFARQQKWTKDATKNPVQYRARICMERFL
ncbi:MAG: GNAT family N-acetyltransferase [Verrucomicrobia bacterium]|nr:GNAT family N-acetyltransferase [Verrucomicrobiota bacterium]